ncbi:hypothetical protein EUTSA_v10002211mg [Eutrema salsugineum]|uniref:Uncharacterized protein n=1 Tax=Eutrema salsugineum TaxID=72664 RepID=V4MC65_EUTSA|nr:hypothetical protein EUTSA_v10002211mg [Eutrema salsugineum]
MNFLSKEKEIYNVIFVFFVARYYNRLEKYPNCNFHHSHMRRKLEFAYFSFQIYYKYYHVIRKKYSIIENKKERKY